MQTLTLRRMIIIGVAIRLAIAPFTAHPIDVYVWFISGLKMIGLEPYNVTCPVNEAYTFCRISSITDYFLPYNFAVLLFATVPATIYWIMSRFTYTGTFSMSMVPSLLNPGPIWQVAYVPGILFNFLVKIPLILSDTVAAFLIYKTFLIFNNNEVDAKRCAILWFLNPLVVWVSAGWGMFDTLPTLMTILSVYFLAKQKALLSSCALAIGTLFKYYPILLLLPVLIYLRRRSGIVSFVKFFVPVLAIGIIYLAVGKNLIVSAATELLTASRFTLTGFNGLSLWTPLVMMNIVASSNIIRYVADVLLVGIIVALSLSLSMRLVEVQQLSDVYLAVLSSALLLFWFVGENFIVWIIPFLSISVVRRAIKLPVYWVSSLIPLVSSVTNSLLPYYLLPVYPWLGSIVLSFMAPLAQVRNYSTVIAGIGISLKAVYLSCLAVGMFIVLLYLSIKTSRFLGNLTGSQLGIRMGNYKFS